MIETSANGVFVIDMQLLEQQGINGIVVVGMGNIGSRIALLLLQSGILASQLTLIDGDTVEPHNLANQLCGAVTGIPKVEGFKNTVAAVLGENVADKLTLKPIFLGEDNDSCMIDEQIYLLNDKLVIFAIDNTECVRVIYNEIVQYATIPMIMFANFSRILRKNNGAGGIGAVTVLPGSMYYRDFFNAFYLGGKEYKEGDENACRLPNAAIVGQDVATLAVKRIVNWSRFLGDKLPNEVTVSQEAMATAVGQDFKVDENGDITTFPFSRSIINTKIVLATGELTLVRTTAGTDTSAIELIENLVAE